MSRARFVTRLLSLLALIALVAGCEPPAAPPKPKVNPPVVEPATDKPAAGEAAPVDKDASKPAPDAVDAAVAEAKQEGKVILGTGELTAGIAGAGPLEIAEIEKWLAEPKNHEVLEVELPLGLAAGASQIKGLDKNPLTRAKIELGRQLYFDPRLSAIESGPEYNTAWVGSSWLFSDWASVPPVPTNAPSRTAS